MENQLIIDIQNKINQLEKEKIEELHKTAVECTGHILPEIAELKSKQVRELYDNRIMELEAELSMIK